MEYGARSRRQGGRPSLPAPALPIPVHDQPAGRLEPPSVADQHGRIPDPRLRRPTRERPRHFHRSLQRGDDPAKVAGLILRIVQVPAPKLRYSAGAATPTGRLPCATPPHPGHGRRRVAPRGDGPAGALDHRGGRYQHVMADRDAAIASELDRLLRHIR
jgi:hypothetical protein